MPKPEDFEIHPAVGVARVGNSQDYYLAPAAAGALPRNIDGTPFTTGDFRDENGLLRRQAAEFAIYYRGAAVEPGTPIGTDDQVVSVRWTVHLANKKAIWYEFRNNAGEHGYPVDHPRRNVGVTDPAQRKKMILDPGPHSVVDKPTPAFKGLRNTAELTIDPRILFLGEDKLTISTLGTVKCQPDGRLWVVGGHGLGGSATKNGSLPSFANNDGWWDDVSDGPVTAEIQLKKGGIVRVADGAWAIVTPPAYAPEIVNLVTLYDTMYDMFVRHKGIRPDIYQDGAWQRTYQPHFDTDVWPILERAANYPWVVAIPPKVHAFDREKLSRPEEEHRQLRQYYVEALRPPDKQNTLSSASTGYRMMPYIVGDVALGGTQLTAKFLTLTPTQYFTLRQWGEGQFIGTGEPDPPAPKPGPAQTRATLDNCTGGAFSPGIEMTWICRNPAIYLDPVGSGEEVRRLFRIRIVKDLPTSKGQLHLDRDFAKGLEPGDITMFMAQPWHADFNLCSSQPVDDHFLWWWPAQRPLFVYAQRDDPEGDWLHVSWVGTARDQTADDYMGFADNVEMVHHWHELGFVARAPWMPEPLRAGPELPDYIEVARILPRDGFVSGFDVVLPAQDRREKAPKTRARANQNGKAKAGKRTR